MDAQLKKGLLDACILSVLEKEPSYGYKLIECTKEIIDISESTLYPILRRLEQQGCLTISSEEHNGRLRKYYYITFSGKERLKEYKKDWIEMKQIYSKIFEKGDNK